MRIPGIDVAALARAHQGSGAGYSADDSWVNIMLEPGFRLWRGVGGRYSPYHIGPNAMGEMSGLTRVDFWQAAQVIKNPKLGYRGAVREYVVMYPTPAAHALCSDNMSFGWGGAEQYFVPEEYMDNLAPSGAEHTLK